MVEEGAEVAASGEGLVEDADRDQVRLDLRVLARRADLAAAHVVLQDEDNVLLSKIYFLIRYKCRRGSSFGMDTGFNAEAVL
jgi:hypothetical protein